VKLPVETHEPNATAGYPSAAGPTTVQTSDDNDIVTTSNGIGANGSSTHVPTLTQTMATTTESVDDAGNAPLNMSSYKDGN